MKTWEFGFGYPTVEVKDGFLRFGRGFTLDKQIPLNTITGITYDGGGVFSLKYKVKIFVGGTLGNSFETQKTPTFEKMIQEIISTVESNKVQNTPIQASIVANQVSITDELIKLASLRDSGILTEDEFEIQKQKILNQ